MRLDIDVKLIPADCLIAERIERLNADDSITGIIVQLPLPDTLQHSQDSILALINPDKDVDGLRPGSPYTPCTPQGIMMMLADLGVYNTRNRDGLAGKRMVIISRSILVGRPLMLLASDAGATVTVCNHWTRNLPAIARQADILVSAAGQPGLIRRNSIEPGALVIDVGITRGADGKLHGDADTDALCGIADVTPVPGGVGRYTVLSLMANVIKAHNRGDRR